MAAQIGLDEKKIIKGKTVGKGNGARRCWGRDGEYDQITLYEVHKELIMHKNVN